MNWIKTYYEISVALIVVILNIYLFNFMNSVTFAILFSLFSIIIVLSVIITPVLLKERVDKFKLVVEYYYIFVSFITLFLLFAFYLLRSVLW
jgi:hypothetical protein